MAGLLVVVVVVSGGAAVVSVVVVERGAVLVVGALVAAVVAASEVVEVESTGSRRQDEPPKMNRDSTNKKDAVLRMGTRKAPDPKADFQVARGVGAGLGNLHAGEYTPRLLTTGVLMDRSRLGHNQQITQVSDELGRLFSKPATI